MKTILIFISSLIFCGSGFAQCPTAGSDSSETYCRYEPFDVAELRSPDADTNGVFIDPMGDTMTNTDISLNFPGQYNYYYHTFDTTCPVDTAKYVITILICGTGGIAENISENHALIKANPANDLLLLNDPDFDLLEIYETSGRRVLLFSKEQTPIDISNLQTGNYLLIHEKNGIRQFIRFIKN